MSWNERMQVSAANPPEHVLTSRITHRVKVLFSSRLITSFAEGCVFSSAHIIQKTNSYTSSRRWKCKYSCSTNSIWTQTWKFIWNMCKTFELCLLIHVSSSKAKIFWRFTVVDRKWDVSWLSEGFRKELRRCRITSRVPSELRTKHREELFEAAITSGSIDGAVQVVRLFSNSRF